jgi:DNA-binding NtrC family response regulator
MSETLSASDCRSVATELVGRSPAAVRIQDFVRRAAALNCGVLIAAEDGSEVDGIAAELHARGHAQGPYFVVDCTDTSSQLEEHLFGAASGDEFDLESVAPTSWIARARGGAMFLRQVTELPAGLQARLARIARDGEVRIAGEPVETELRLIASAPPEIDADVSARRFRADLFRRLSVIRIDVAPLRERQGDVPELAARLLDDVCGVRGIAPRRFSSPALALIAGLRWPGNVRELRDVIDRVVSETDSDVIDLQHVLPAVQIQAGSERFAPSGSLREARQRFERDYIASVLKHHGWHMTNAAQTLGIQRPNLYRKARQLGIPLTKVSE